MPTFSVQITWGCGYVDTDDQRTPQGLPIRTVQDVIAVVQATNPNLLSRFSLTKLSLHLPIIQHQYHHHHHHENEDANGSKMEIEAGDLIPMDKDIEYLATTGFGYDDTNPFVLRINEPYIVVKKQIRIRLPFEIEGIGDSYIATVESFVPCPSMWFRVKYMLGLASVDVDLHIPEGGGQLISSSFSESEGALKSSIVSEETVRLRPYQEKIQN